MDFSSLKWNSKKEVYCMKTSRMINDNINQMRGCEEGGEGKERLMER